jgi:hypothetical protein
MLIKQEPAFIRHLIGQFKRGAIVAHFGYEDENYAMQRVGLKSAQQVVTVLDTYEDGREALVPLLDDPDQGIRVIAASHLLKTMPERALAVIEEIHERCPTEARLTAASILISREAGILDL